MAQAKAAAKKTTGGAKAKRTAARKTDRPQAVKTAAKGGKPVARAAKKTVSRKKAAKQEVRYGCEVCGLVVRVDEWGDMNIVNLVCCGEQMGPA